MKIRLMEFLKPEVKFDSLPEEIQANLRILFHRLNCVRNLYGSPMEITSGLRSMEEHLDLYHRINDQRRSKGLSFLKVPIASLHLEGAAADIDDPRGLLQKWVLEHLEVIEQLGLYLEDFHATPTWCHFQIYPPASGKRFFEP